MSNNYSSHIENLLQNPVTARAVHIVLRPPNTLSRYVHMKDPIGPQWCYAHIRQLVLDVNNLVLNIQANGCSKKTCSTMQIGDHQIYCTAHPTPLSCSALDYCYHTLEASECLLSDTCLFPKQSTIPESSIGIFSSIFRRLYRVMAHAWFSHPQAFMAIENQISLFRRAMGLASAFDLIPSSEFVIPICNDPMTNRKLLLGPAVVNFNAALKTNKKWLKLTHQHYHLKTQPASIRSSEDYPDIVPAKSVGPSKITSNQASPPPLQSMDIDLVEQMSNLTQLFKQNASKKNENRLAP